MKQFIQQLYDILHSYQPSSNQYNSILFKQSISCSAKLNDILPLFERSSLDVIYHYSNTKNCSWLGIGEAEKYVFENQFQKKKGVRYLEEKIKNGSFYFSGTVFDEDGNDGEEWNIFGKQFWIEPLVLLKQTNDDVEIFVANSEDADVQLTEIKKILQSFQNLSQEKYSNNKCVSKNECPLKDSFLMSTKEVIEKIKQAKLEKVVLAKKTELVFDQWVSAALIFKEMMHNDSNCAAFFVKFKQFSFISVTPETLFQRDQNKLSCDIIAGTRPMSELKTNTEKYKLELLKSEKDKKEHDYVIDGVIQSLNPLTETCAVINRYHILQLSKVQHLTSVVKGQLKKNITDIDLIDALHPTAAVAGTPKNDAKKEIAQHEVFARGLYTGCVGVVSKDFSELLVAIRCCLIHAEKMFSYAGAGLVAESNPESEWDEILAKSAHITNLVSTETHAR